ncbi:MAG: ankyrin repeat domain-containing protein [Rhodospirillales bacterium]|nr:ankyrin repeat domain-containing protein [Rhodospirillales bacterium]
MKLAFFASALLLAAPLRADADCQDWLDKAFWQAAAAAEVTRCLAAGADLNARIEKGNTPLHLAAVFGNAEAVAALLDAGADPNARGEGGLTPLHAAAAHGSAEVVAALLDAGADGSARTARGSFPADLAKENEKLRNNPVYWRLNDARYR